VFDSCGDKEPVDVYVCVVVAVFAVYCGDGADLVDVYECGVYGVYSDAAVCGAADYGVGGGHDFVVDCGAGGDAVVCV